MSELISEELFDKFRSSSWPRQFSGMAQAASAESVAIDELASFPTRESDLIIVPKQEQQMLEDMGIVEDRLSDKGFVTPSMVKDGFHGDPNTYMPHFSEFGKQVIMACEDLHTPEDHADAAESAQPELERLITETNAQLGI